MVLTKKYASACRKYFTETFKLQELKSFASQVGFAENIDKDITLDRMQLHANIPIFGSCFIISGHKIVLLIQESFNMESFIYEIGNIFSDLIYYGVAAKIVDNIIISPIIIGSYALNIDLNKSIIKSGIKYDIKNKKTGKTKTYIEMIIDLENLRKLEDQFNKIQKI